VYSVDALHLYN